MIPQILSQITFYDTKLSTNSVGKYSLETGKWQGEVLDFIKQTDEPQLCNLFHNKDSNYPVIQFRNDEGFPAIASIGVKASQAMGYFAEAYAKKYPNKTKNTFQQTVYYAPVVLKQPKQYQIEYYLFPHSKRNEYINLETIWKDIDSIRERLHSNIYELLYKQLGFDIPNYIIEIENISSPSQFRTYKPFGTFFEQGVSIRFTSNLLLPKLAAIGTGKSKGYGIIR